MHLISKGFAMLAKNELDQNMHKDEARTEGLEGFKDFRLRKLHGFVSSPAMLCCTTFFTVLCLFGEDIRIYFFTKPADYLFNIVFVLCLVYFVLEFAFFCITQDGYRWGFFFWMDLVATVSLALDINWSMSTVDRWRLDWLYEGQQKSAYVDARTTGVIGMVRLIRLIRLMKLYRMTTARSETDQEDRLREEARAALNAKQAALKRVEASRLGKQLSDMITRVVILGVLLVLICLPLIRTTILVDNSRWLGLRNLFRLGVNVCGVPGGAVEPCLIATAAVSFRDNSYRTRVLVHKFVGLKQNAEMAWNWAVLRYAGVYRSTPTSKLLWLHIPSLQNGGKLRDIAAVTVENDGQVLEWTATTQCAGKFFPLLQNTRIRNPNCPWREEEQDLITYEAQELRAYAKFLVRDRKKQEAVLSMLLTLFVISILCILTFVFARDTQALIVAPIEKMVNIVKQLADDPLHPPGIRASGEATDKSRKTSELETSMLESTILKIGGLLQVGFGEAGANVVSRNMKSGEGDLNIMIPGDKVQAIFGFCDIRQFTEITECLQEDVMAFINTVGGILHHCCHLWSGAASQNVGDTFLFTWKLGHTFDLDNIRDTQDASGSGEMANKALVAFVKSIMEIKRSANLVTFERDPRLTARFGINYHIKINCGLHVGWAVEGAIGSDYKVDASYLSPHVTLTRKIQEAAQLYDTPLLLSDAFYFLLSIKAKTRIRKVDVVKADEHQQQPLGLYCFDVNEGVTFIRDTNNRVIGDVIKPEDVLEIPTDHLRGAGVEYMFVVDADIIASQRGFPDQFYVEYRAAFCNYVEGDWTSACEKLQKCVELVPGDGPSKALLNFIKTYDCKAPGDWRGYRVLRALKIH